DRPGGGETPGPPEPPLPPGEDDDPGGGTTPPPGGDDDDDDSEPPAGDDDDDDGPPPVEDPPDDPPGLGVPRDPSGGGSPSDDVPFTEGEIAQKLAHRPHGEGETSITIADTYSAEHSTGDEVRPAFVLAAYLDEFAGFDDIVTVATEDGAQEELRIQHGYVIPSEDMSGWEAQDADANWVALTSFPSTAYDYDDSKWTSIVRGTVERRLVLRCQMFPSGELPEAIGDQVYLGSRFDGGGIAQAYIDELYFKPERNDRIYYLGDGGLIEDEDDESDSGNLRYPAIDEAQIDIPIHMWTSSANKDGLPVRDLPEEGGVIRIDDEIIAYEELDTADGMLKGCLRGALGSEASPHAFNARVTEVNVVTAALLAGGIDADSSSIALNRIDYFPASSGYVRIDDEIIGYTRTQGSTLLMPEELRSEDEDYLAPPKEPEQPDEPTDEDVEAGSGIFHGRFGTEATAHDDRAIVFHHPARYPDRYRELSVDPALSALVISKRVDGAIWKRLAWDEKTPEFTDVEVYVRFDGTPEWDSESIYNVNEGMVVSGSSDDFAANPKGFLYLIDSPHGMNRFREDSGVQADRIEVRITYKFESGAYLPKEMMDPPPNSWKDTPWLKALRFEYVSPVTVHYTEEVR
ncbi:MAG: hypothetical protein ACYS99_23440, partial [Planctomycetota bacterium]